MRESQYEPTIEIRKSQEATKLYETRQVRPIPNDLDLSWIHMHTLLINNVSSILDLFHAKETFFHDST